MIVHVALPIAAASLPLQAYNISEVTRRTPGRTPAGEALEQLGAGFDKRVDEIAPGRKPVLGLELNVPKGNVLSSMKDTSKYASNQDVTSKSNAFNTLTLMPIGPYFAHELGRIASAQTDIGHFIRSARSNKALSRSLGAAALLGAGGTAAATAGDDDCYYLCWSCICRVITYDC